MYYSIYTSTGDIMRVKKQQLRNLILREMKTRRVFERVRPETLDIQGDEFTVMADPTRPEEGDSPEEIKGKIVQYQGRNLPKADPENLPFGYKSARSVSGQLSAQLKDTLSDLLGAAPNVTPEQRQTKGMVIANALAALSEKYPDDQDVVTAIDAILSVNMGFDVPYGGEEVEMSEEEVVAEALRVLSER